MELTSPMSFLEAVKSLASRGTMPTNLGSSELRLLDAAVRRQSLFSARTLMSDYLEEIRGAVQSIVEPATGVSQDRRTADNPEGFVTAGIDPATARLKLKEKLKELGYAPGEDEKGTIQDLSSDRRINLVVKTNVELAQGAGHFIQGQDADVLEAFPAQELVRFEAHTKERDWKQRWTEASQASGDYDAARVLSEQGRMVARKDSPVWDALGDSSLFPDGLDNPFPPFAFNSGMWVQDVDFATAEKFGLVTMGNVPRPQSLDLGSLFGKS